MTSITQLAETFDVAENNLTLRRIVAELNGDGRLAKRFKEAV